MGHYTYTKWDITFIILNGTLYLSYLNLFTFLETLFKWSFVVNISGKVEDKKELEKLYGNIEVIEAEPESRKSAHP